MIKKLLNIFQKTKIRQYPEDKICPFCSFGIPIIYDQEHDCCTTCQTKWEITQDK